MPVTMLSPCLGAEREIETQKEWERERQREWERELRERERNEAKRERAGEGDGTRSQDVQSSQAANKKTPVCTPSENKERETTKPHQKGTRKGKRQTTPVLRH